MELPTPVCAHGLSPPSLSVLGGQLLWAPPSNSAAISKSHEQISWDQRVQLCGLNMPGKAARLGRCRAGRAPQPLASWLRCNGCHAQTPAGSQLQQDAQPLQECLTQVRSRPAERLNSSLHLAI